MGIDLPDELAEAAAEAGLSWPRLDEESLREQAALWRSTSEQLVALGEDASQVAIEALKDLPEKAAGEMLRSWQAFMGLDSGRLTIAIQGANQAAQRLERAADLVGESKVELVRDLISIAKLRDIASLTMTVTPAIVDQSTAAETWNKAFQEAAAHLRRTAEKLSGQLEEMRHL